MIKVSIISCFYNEEQYVDRLLDSIPRRDDIEVLARDDASTDGTYAKLLAYQEAHPELNLKVYHDDVNHGAFYNGNQLLDLATGEYIHFVDGDDYVYTDAYSQAIDQINGEDCVYINLRVNDGNVFTLEEDTRSYFCAPTTKFVRRAFGGDIRFPMEGKLVDWDFNNELLSRNPVSKYTNITAYHYNHPREGSICNLVTRGLM